MTDTALIPECSDMQAFTPEQLKRAGELLGCQLDQASALKALIIQRDTGLSITRGEICIVSFGGKPTVMINKAGYLAYASRQPDYDGYESGVETEDGEMYAWCHVYSRTRTRPTKVKIYRSEFDQKRSVWLEKPRYMLEKTAISLALRAAYPILNGTYTEEELQGAVKIEPRESDIPVTPVIETEEAPKEVETPKPEPEQAPEPKQKLEQKPAVPKCRTYQQIEAQKVLENMVSQGMNIDIFDKARLSTGEYNRDMIDADFAQQLAAKKAARAAAAQPKPQHKTCTDCGKRVLEDEEKISMDKYSTPLCRTCLEKRLAAKIQQENKKDETKKCELCGKELSETEYEKSMQKFGKPICPVCWINTYAKKE